MRGCVGCRKFRIGVTRRKSPFEAPKRRGPSPARLQTRYTLTTLTERRNDTGTTGTSHHANGASQGPARLRPSHGAAAAWARGGGTGGGSVAAWAARAAGRQRVSSAAALSAAAAVGGGAGGGDGGRGSGGEGGGRGRDGEGGDGAATDGGGGGAAWTEAAWWRRVRRW